MGRPVHVLLIEPSGQHLEFLYSQIIMLLRSGCTVSVGICSQAFETDLMSSFQKRVKFIIRKKKEPFISFLFRLQIYVHVHSAALIIFNSIEKRLHKLFSLFFFWFTPVAKITYNRCAEAGKSGIIDNLIKLKMFNTIYVSKLNSANAVTFGRPKKVNYFYPVHAREFLRTKNIDYKNIDHHGLINIGFIGDNGFTTGDYLELIEWISLLDPVYRNRIGVFVISKLDENNTKIVSDKMAEKRLSGRVLSISQCNSYEEFYRISSKLNFLMPVVKRTRYGSIFTDLSGLNLAISIALTIHKPLVLSDNFHLEMSLQPIAVFYSDESLRDGFITALEMKADNYNKICSHFKNIDEASEEMQLLLYRKMLRSVL